MAWTIELDQAAVRDLDKLDQKPRRRILTFLHDRVATLDNPRSIGEALKGSTLGEFWKYRLDRKIFYTLTEAKILIERWRREDNTVRPHRALGSRPPAPAALSPAPLSGLIMSPALS